MEKPKAGEEVKELLSKVLEFGIGAAYATTEAAKKLVDELVAKGAVKKQESGEVLQELLERGKHQKEEMEGFVSRLVERAVEKSNLARRSDLEKLEARVKALEQKRSDL